VDIDILKPDTGIMSIERPSNVTSATESPMMRTPDPEHDHGGMRHQAYTEPVSEGEDDDDEENALVPALDEGKRTGLQGEELEQAIAERNRVIAELREEERKRKERQETEGAEETRDSDEVAIEDADEHTPFLPDRGRRRPSQPLISSTENTRALSIDPLAPSRMFDATFRKLKSEVSISKQLRQRMGGVAEADQNGRSRTHDAPDETSTNDTGEGSQERHRAGHGEDERLLERNWRADPGKRIAVPVRVEPKVYFASERTFLVCSPAVSHHKY
jgi:hypothetical protein